MKATARSSLFAVVIVAVISASGTVSPQLDGVALEHPANACSAPFHVSGASWDFCWQQDSARAQGLEVNRAYFHGKQVVWKMGIPFTLTRYDNETEGPYKDVLGSPGSAGLEGFGNGPLPLDPDECPRFLATGVLLNDQRLCVERRGGPEQALAVWSRYSIVNYRFLQGYVFDARGVIQPLLRLGGVLADGSFGADGTNHFHHVFWRIDLDVAAGGGDALQAFVMPEGAGKPWVSRSDLPTECRALVREGSVGWCDIHNESALFQHASLYTKWRVQDSVEVNANGYSPSFELRVHSDGSVDRNYTHFDALLLQHHGDSQELGYEVPTFPVDGDSPLLTYLDPPEAVTDPVVWVGMHVFHDPRSEDFPTMTYHDVSFSLSPRDFLSENLGESTFTGSSLPPLPVETHPIR